MSKLTSLEIARIQLSVLCVTGYFTKHCNFSFMKEHVKVSSSSMNVLEHNSQNVATNLQNETLLTKKKKG